MAEADEQFALVYNPRPVATKEEEESQQQRCDANDDEQRLPRSVSSASLQDVLTKVLCMSDLTTLGVTTDSTPQTCRADLRRRPSQQLFNTQSRSGTAAAMTPGYPILHKVPSKTNLPLPPTAMGGGMALLSNRRCTSLLDLNSLSAQQELAAQNHHRRPFPMGLPSSMGLDPIFQEDHEDEDVLCF